MLTILTRSVILFLCFGNVTLVCLWWAGLFFVVPSLAVFYKASVFNRDVSKWNTGAVTDMSSSKCTCTLFPFLWPHLPLLYLLSIRQLEFHYRITLLTRSVIFVFVCVETVPFFCGLWWDGLSLFFVAPSLFAVFKASAFNQDVSKWNTAAVTTMQSSKYTLSPSLWPRLHVFHCCVF